MKVYYVKYKLHGECKSRRELASSGKWAVRLVLRELLKEAGKEWFLKDSEMYERASEIGITDVQITTY
jgi:hypothetical protein